MTDDDPHSVGFLGRSHEEQFDEDPEDCSHEQTRTRVNSGGPNTETCDGCGKSWTPPRD